MGTRGRWAVPPHGAGAPGRSRSAARGHLGRRRLPHRRWRQVVAGEQRGHRGRVPPDAPSPSSASACTRWPGTRATPSGCTCSTTEGSIAATTAVSRGGDDGHRRDGLRVPRGRPSDAARHRLPAPLESDGYRCTPDGRCTVWRTSDAGKLGTADGRAAHNTTRTSRCCGTPSPRTGRSRPACTSGPGAARCRGRWTTATGGGCSPTTCRPCSRSGRLRA